MTARARSISPALGALAVSGGGALGAIARWTVTEALPAAGTGFPWSTFLVNVTGSALLAALPLLALARRHAWVGLFAGTGLLGGFTTMSAASVDAVVLGGAGVPWTAMLYVAGTLAAALGAVLVVDRYSSPADRAAAEDAGWDE